MVDALHVEKHWPVRAHPNFLALHSRFFTKQSQLIFPDFSTIILSFSQTICIPVMLNSSILNGYALLFYNHMFLTDCSLYLKCFPSTLLCLANSLSFETCYVTSSQKPSIWLSLTVSHSFLHPSRALRTHLYYTTHYIISELWTSISPTRTRESSHQYFMWAKVMEET